jgi:hypothetical protein
MQLYGRATYNANSIGTGYISPFSNQPDVLGPLIVTIELMSGLGQKKRNPHRGVYNDARFEDRAFFKATFPL